MRAWVLPFVLFNFLASLVAAHTDLDIFSTIDSTSGVLINRSFTHRGIIEVMEAARSGSIRYPGTPAVSYGFDPVQGIYDLPPNASSVLRALAQRTAAANARRPSEFSLESFLDSGSLGYKSLELFEKEGIEETHATFTLMIGGGQTAVQVNVSMDAFATTLNKSVHKEKLFPAGASLHITLVPDEVEDCNSDSFRDMLNTANGAARRLTQSLSEMCKPTKVYVGVHLRFTATDDRVLDATMLPPDFGDCMEAIISLDRGTVKAPSGLYALSLDLPLPTAPALADFAAEDKVSAALVHGEAGMRIILEAMSQYLTSAMPVMPLWLTTTMPEDATTVAFPYTGALMGLVSVSRTMAALTSLVKPPFKYALLRGLVSHSLATQASDPLLASLPLRISPPLASVSDSIDDEETVVNSAFQIVASVMGAHITSAVAFTQEQMGTEAELPFSMLGDYQLPCVQAIRTTETRNEYRLAQKLYSFAAMNRCNRPVSISLSIRDVTDPNSPCSGFKRSQVTFTASQVASADWSDLGEALDAFKSSEYLYYGGPLGNRLNATIKEPYTPVFRNSSKNVTIAYLEMELPPLSLTRSLVYYQDFYCSQFFNTTTGRMQLCGLRQSTAPTLPPGPLPTPTANGGHLQNVTVYRVTPRNITDLCNKDTADPAGDYGFYLHVVPRDKVCRNGEPTHWQSGCFLGHDNIFLQITLEFDGWVAEYQPCNPVGNGSPWPKLNLSDFECLQRPLFSNGDIDNTSSCQRIVNAVGGERYNIDGYWWNTPSQGQCGPGQSPGDESGCTWRLVEVAKAINETCMRRHFGEYFATLPDSKECFATCPKPWDVRSDCFIDCFAKTEHYNESMMLSTWRNAFAFENVSLGGCPSLPPVVPSPAYCRR